MGGSAAGAAVEPLDAGERVARLCFSASVPFCACKYPDQIDPATGLVRLEEISFSELKRGFSMQRIRLYCQRKGEQRAGERAARWRAKGHETAEFQLVGALVAKVSDIQSISCEEGAQIFEVLAKPVTGDPGHVEVHFKGDIKKHVFLEHRQKLQAVLGAIVDPAVLDEAA